MGSDTGEERRAGSLVEEDGGRQAKGDRLVNEEHELDQAFRRRRERDKNLERVTPAGGPSILLFFE
jgi:hypothetical protein